MSDWASRQRPPPAGQLFLACFPWLQGRERRVPDGAGPADRTGCPLLVCTGVTRWLWSCTRPLSYTRFETAPAHSHTPALRLYPPLSYTRSGAAPTPVIYPLCGYTRPCHTAFNRWQTQVGRLPPDGHCLCAICVSDVRLSDGIGGSGDVFIGFRA